MNSSVIRDEFTTNNKKVQFFRLIGYFKPHIPMLVLCTFLAFLINATILIKPYIIKYVIDEYLVAGRYDISGIRLMGLLFFIIVVLGAVFTYIQAYVLTYIGQKIMYKIRHQLFKHIQEMSMRFFDKNSSGRILTRITNDVESLNELFSGIIINIFRDSIMITGIVVMMLVMDVKLALVCISSIPLIALVAIFYRKAARKNFIQMKGMLAKINAFLAENISGMKLVQIFHREKEKFEELLHLDKQYFASSLREVILNSLCRPVVDIINNLTIALLIWFCTGRFLDNTLEIGVMYAFITYIKQIFDPISAISEQYTTIQSAVISSERIFEILDNSEAVEDLNSGISVNELKGEIEFRNVWFAYDDKNWVLKDVCFIINSGEVTAFVGSTGCGKSTIIGLMARFYEVQKGEILLDGININEYRLKDLRKQIAVVLQDVFLFSGDVKSNIRLRNMHITDEDIRDAAHFVSADKFIESLPGKYDEEVKERGCTLSAGQKQLISFTRAVAFRPSILVLDEATANIDTETEAVIQKAMVEITRGKTSIIIAHRLSTIRNADKIIVVHKGSIKETGNHSELISRNGIYSHLYKMQFYKDKIPS